MKRGEHRRAASSSPHPLPSSVVGNVLFSFRLLLGNILFGIIRGSSHPGGARVSPGRLIKWPCKQTELEALLHVAANATIPVPKVYRSFQYHGELAIELEYLRGCKTIQDAWHDLSEQDKERIAEQVAGYIEDLRALQPTDKHRISSTDGGQCRDIRIGSVKLFRPFEDIPKFHNFIRGGMPIENAHTVFSHKVADIHDRRYSIRLTHGDLASLNNFVRDRNVAAVIDWECAGWYLEYWAYTQSHYNTVYKSDSHRILHQKITRYDEEPEALSFLLTRYHDERTLVQARGISKAYRSSLDC